MLLFCLWQLTHSAGPNGHAACFITCQALMAHAVWYGSTKLICPAQAAMLLTWSAMLISSYTAYSVSSDSQTVQSTQAVMLPAQSVPLINHHYWPDSMTISSWLGWPDTATDQTALSARHSLFELENPVFAVDFPFPASHFGPDSDTLLTA